MNSSYRFYACKMPMTSIEHFLWAGHHCENCVQLSNLHKKPMKQVPLSSYQGVSDAVQVTVVKPVRLTPALSTPLSELWREEEHRTETEHMVSAFSPHSLLHHPEHLASMSPTLPSLQIILKNKQEVILQTFTVYFKCHANRKGYRGGQEAVVMHQGAVLEGKAV